MIYTNVFGTPPAFKRMRKLMLSGQPQMWPGASAAAPGWGAYAVNQADPIPGMSTGLGPKRQRLAPALFGGAAPRRPAGF